jgi:hypothetical protein
MTRPTRDEQLFSEWQVSIENSLVDFDKSKDIVLDFSFFILMAGFVLPNT